MKPETNNSNGLSSAGNHPNILQLFDKQCDRLSEQTFLAEHLGGDVWEELTWSQVQEQVQWAAAGFCHLGLVPGGAVAILSANRNLWPVCDLAAIQAGGVGVGLYPTSSPDQCAYMLNHCEAAFLIVDSAEQLAKINHVIAQLPKLSVIIAGGDLDASGVRPGSLPARVQLLGLGEFLDAGKKKHHEYTTRLDDFTSNLGREDTAALVYTSGTTGDPKAAVLSHRYFLSNADSLQAVFDFQPGEKILSYLPYCHVGERIFGWATSLLTGRAVYHLPDITAVFSAITSVEPHVFGGIPRLYEKMHSILLAHLADLPENERQQIQAAREKARLYFDYRLAGKEIPGNLAADYEEADANYLSALRARILGSSIRVATSGAASLPGDVADFFVSIGLPIYEAYGLTENICAAMNRPDKHRIKTVGVAMPHCEMKLADDGEVWLKGSNQFSGYLNNMEATADCFDETGIWLKTGDIGQFDDDGFLRIIDRKKEILITSTGKNIAPTKIENEIKSEPVISNVMLVGDGRSYITALVTVHPSEAFSHVDGLAAAYEQQGGEPLVQSMPPQVPESTYQWLGESKILHDYIDRHIRLINNGLNRTEQIKKFKIVPKDFTINDGELTPTLKLKRRVIAEKYADLIAALYQTAAV